MTKLILSVLFLAFIFPLGCARNPVTGQRQIVLVSESEEIAMGQQSDRQVRQEYGVVENLQRFAPEIERSIRSFEQLTDPRIRGARLHQILRPSPGAFAPPSHRGRGNAGAKCGNLVPCGI